MVVLETIQLMVNIFSLSFQTILRKEALFYQSVKDGLTGLFNRRYFDSALKIAVERCERNVDYCFTLIMFDIDHFKKFNDTYGHQTGDDVLQQVAKHILKAIRKTDVFCRYGGEEFAVILCGTDAEKGFLVAEKIRKVVEKIKIKTPIDTTKVTISLGIAQYFSGDDEEEMIKKADSALYQSKERGRNRSSVFVKEI
jgi:diguanylate cyclase (GGDEF)-like protein